MTNNDYYIDVVYSYMIAKRLTSQTSKVRVEQREKFNVMLHLHKLGQNQIMRQTRLKNQ